MLGRIIEEAAVRGIHTRAIHRSDAAAPTGAVIAERDPGDDNISIAAHPYRAAVFARAAAVDERHILDVDLAMLDVKNAKAIIPVNGMAVAAYR